jgi:purine-binding chemotaxis protein CheW
MEIAKRKLLSGSRFLSFMLYNEEYCIEILRIKEIMGMIDITMIPQTPQFIKGVINLRGRIIPIIDLRAKLGLPVGSYTDRTCIIITEVEYAGDLTLMGVIVDSIQEVIHIPEENMSRLPYLDSRVNSRYISAIAEVQNKIKILIDIAKVLTDEEFVLVKNIDESKPGIGNNLSVKSDTV